jgi:hypothetical protein
VKCFNHGTGLQSALFTASEPAFWRAPSECLGNPRRWFGTGHEAYTRRLVLRLKRCYWRWFRLCRVFDGDVAFPIYQASVTV